jgi:hypothetical protein
VPQPTRFIEDPAIAPVILTIAAAAGAVAWWLAGRSVGVARTKLERPMVLERDRRRAA